MGANNTCTLYILLEQVIKEELRYTGIYFTYWFMNPKVQGTFSIGSIHIQKDLIEPLGLSSRATMKITLCTLTIIVHILFSQIQLKTAFK